MRLLEASLRAVARIASGGSIELAMSHSEVFIIGAGPAGLTSSYLLTKQGVSTTVIEMDPEYVGGISRTASYKGYLFDIGGHRFFSKSKEVVDLWKEILPQDFIDRPRLSRIYYDGKYYSYPLKAFEALSNLGVVESAMPISFRRSTGTPVEPRRGSSSVSLIDLRPAHLPSSQSALFGL